MRACFDRAAVGLVAFDASLTVTACNARGAEMIGGRAAEVVGTSVPSFVKKAAADAISGGREIRGELARGPRGDAVLVHVSAARDDAGVISGGVITLVAVAEPTRAEEELRTERRWLEATLDALPVGVWMYNRDRSRRRRNAAAVEMEGRGLRPRIPKDEWPIERTVRTGTMIAGEHVELVGDAGATMDVRAWTASIRDGEDGVLGYVAILVDVTNALRVERALEFERSRLAKVFTVAPACIAVLRGPEHVFELANEETYRLWGRRELIGKRLADVLPEVFEQGFGAILDGVLASGEPYIGREVAIAIAREPNAPKEVRYVDFVYQPLVEQDETRSGMLIHGVDVTERVRADVALRASERRVRAQFKGFPVPTFAWQLSDVGDGQKDLVLVDYNDEAMEVTEGRVATLIGTRATTLYRDRPEIIDDLHAAIAGGRVGREMEYAFLAGHTRRLNVTYTAVPPDLVLVHTEDVTDKAVLEQQLRQAQKMEAVGRLAGGIAHDFNNLLTVISTCAHFLSESVEAHRELLEDVTSIQAAADQAAALTKQLLAFSRKQLLVPTVIDLNEVTRSIEPMLRRLIGEDIKVIVETAAHVGAVKADRGQVEQVIVNLVVNARDAMPGGGIVTIATRDVVLEPAAAARFEVEPGSYSVVAVRDAGTGMDAETAAHVFEPFFTTKSTGLGTGLGLSTAYGIARQSGGFMTVSSKVGAGSTFELGLPHAARPVGAAASTVSSDRPGSGKVLLVEDEATVRAVARRLLEREGYEVVEASNGRAALEMVTRTGRRFDVLVTDVVMPELGGRQLYAELQKLQPGLPVLFMSGYTDDEILRRGSADAGADPVVILPKPFTPEDLARAVRRALERATKPSP
jgi:two-component system, cell cycle sensor histidine kinase and response regulator CckA